MDVDEINESPSSMVNVWHEDVGRSPSARLGLVQNFYGGNLRPLIDSYCSSSRSVYSARRSKTAPSGCREMRGLQPMPHRIQAQGLVLLLVSFVIVKSLDFKNRTTVLIIWENECPNNQNKLMFSPKNRQHLKSDGKCFKGHLQCSST